MMNFSKKRTSYNVIPNEKNPSLHISPALSATATETTATITFSGYADSYEVEIVAGSWQGSMGNAEPISTTSHTFTDLQPGTAYSIAVRSVCVDDYYGDTTSAVGIRVHRLTENLDREANYYQTSTASYDPQPINYQLTSYTLKPKTPVVVDTGVYNAHLRVRLSQAFGQELLNHQSEINSNLRDYLKGLYVEAISHTGNRGYMLSTNMTSALSGVTIYYHNDSTQNLRYTLVCSESCMRFSHFNHDYNASQDNDFVSEVLQHQTAIGTDKLFVQGGGGVKTRITFPYLEHAFDQYNQRVAIHRAELVITNVDPHEVYLTPPTNLTIQGIGKSNGAIRFLPDDDYYTSSNYYGGIYNEKTREYRFRITKYVQQLILGQGDWENSINLIVRGSAVRPQRLIFDGTDPASPTRLRLEISYSTY